MEPQKILGDAASYISIIKNKHMLRCMIANCKAVESEAFDDMRHPAEIASGAVERFLSTIEQFRAGDTSGRLVKISDFLPVERLHIDALSAKGSDVTGVSSGYREIDEWTYGFQPGDLILLAARPSQGKTALALDFAINSSARDNDSAVVLFSIEMSRRQLIQRMLSMVSGVDLKAFRTGSFKQNNLEEMLEAFGVLAQSSIYVDDSSKLTVVDMLTRCRNLKNRIPIKLIIVDYIQLISTSGRRAENRVNELAEISRALKALAKELDAPVIALSQLSRAVEQREREEKGRPMLSDLRDSGALEQDADVVMFIYRPDKYGIEDAVPDEAEIIFAKQRNGPVGSAYLRFHPLTTHFHGRGFMPPKPIDKNMPGWVVVDSFPPYSTEQQELLPAVEHGDAYEPDTGEEPINVDALPLPPAEMGF
jgi:replicative DNA helicase